MLYLKQIGARLWRANRPQIWISTGRPIQQPFEVAIWEALCMKKKLMKNSGSFSAILITPCFSLAQSAVLRHILVS